MFKIIQEATLPKLSQTSLYNKFNDSSNITSNLINEIKTAGSTAVKLDELSEILSLIKLNGDPVVKKAVNHLTDGDIVIVVPSRALISEYIFEILDILKLDKDVLVMQFVELVNLKHSKRRIYVIPNFSRN